MCHGILNSAYGNYKFTGKKISEEVDVEGGELEGEYEDYDQDDGMDDSDSEYFWGGIGSRPRHEEKEGRIQKRK